MNPPDQPLPSAAIYDSIIQEAGHEKTKTAIRHVKTACDYFDEKKMEISVIEVGRFCNETGPKTQSLRNNPKFCNYIGARRAEQTIAPSAKPTGIKLTTNDPQANAVIYALETRAKMAEQRLTNLKHALSRNQEYDLDAMMKTGKLVRFAPESSVITGLTQELVDSLQRVFEPNHLRRFALVIKDGCITGMQDRVFAEPADWERISAAMNTKKALPDQKKEGPELPPRQPPQSLTDGTPPNTQ